MHYLLIYDLVDDYLDRRAEFRDAHLALAWQAADRGDLVLAGALEDPTDTAALLFEGDSASSAEAFANADPYVQNGLVKSWRVRPWKTVVGKLASTPAR
ncbi:YciI-like protein [Pandoraea pneumonica]|uniref:YciI-like protein n=1 Tax=Pandoraea pneumonica TaxID=2508299 RepID=UPI003CEE77BD